MWVKWSLFSYLAYKQLASWLIVCSFYISHNYDVLHRGDPVMCKCEIATYIACWVIFHRYENLKLDKVKEMEKVLTFLSFKYEREDLIRRLEDDFVTFKRYRFTYKHQSTTPISVRFYTPSRGGWSRIIARQHPISAI